MPGNPAIVSPWRPTGKYRLRTGWRGRLIVQVQEEQEQGALHPDGPHWSAFAQTRWRDGRLEDFTAGIELEVAR